MLFFKKVLIFLRQSTTYDNLGQEVHYPPQEYVKHSLQTRRFWKNGLDNFSNIFSLGPLVLCTLLLYQSSNAFKHNGNIPCVSSKSLHMVRQVVVAIRLSKAGFHHFHISVSLRIIIDIPSMEQDSIGLSRLTKVTPMSAAFL